MFIAADMPWQKRSERWLRFNGNRRIIKYPVSTGCFNIFNTNHHLTLWQSITGNAGFMRKQCCMKRLYAIIGTLGLTFFSYFLVTACTDVVLTPASSSESAAIAIRDEAPGYEQWGTEHFTTPYLNRYRQFWYFNQTGRGSRKKEFLNALRFALNKYEHVDLFLLAHTNTYYRWVKEIKPALRKKIRLVYNSGCDNLDQGQQWLKMGVQTYVGHPGRSASPLFYFYFLRRWTHGASVHEAVAASNSGMGKLLDIGSFFSQGGLDAGTVYENSKACIYGDRTARF
jgi:hypothetical protein